MSQVTQVTLSVGQPTNNISCSKQSCSNKITRSTGESTQSNKFAANAFKRAITPGSLVISKKLDGVISLSSNGGQPVNLTKADPLYNQAEGFLKSRCSSHPLTMLESLGIEKRGIEKRGTTTTPARSSTTMGLSFGFGLTKTTPAGSDDDEPLLKTSTARTTTSTARTTTSTARTTTPRARTVESDDDEPLSTTSTARTTTPRARTDGSDDDEPLSRTTTARSSTRGNDVTHKNPCLKIYNIYQSGGLRGLLSQGLDFVKNCAKGTADYVEYLMPAQYAEETPHAYFLGTSLSTSAPKSPGTTEEETAKLGKLQLKDGVDESLSEDDTETQTRTNEQPFIEMQSKQRPPLPSLVPSLVPTDFGSVSPRSRAASSEDDEPMSQTKVTTGKRHHVKSRRGFDYPDNKYQQYPDHKHSARTQNQTGGYGQFGGDDTNLFTSTGNPQQPVFGRPTEDEFDASVQELFFFGTPSTPNPSAPSSSSSTWDELGSRGVSRDERALYSAYSTTPSYKQMVAPSSSSFSSLTSSSSSSMSVSSSVSSSSEAPMSVSSSASSSSEAPEQEAPKPVFVMDSSKFNYDFGEYLSFLNFLTASAQETLDWEGLAKIPDNYAWFNEQYEAWNLNKQAPNLV